MAWLRHRGTGALTELLADSVVIGRDADGGVVTDDLRVSRRHAELIRRGEQWWVRDCGSRNGTFVNDAPVVIEEALSAGDCLRVGSTVYVYMPEDDPRATIGDDAGESPAVRRALHAALSPNERATLALVAAGRTDVQIAAALNISPKTVANVLDRIKDKTGWRRRADLTRLAIDLGLEIPTT